MNSKKTDYLLIRRKQNISRSVVVTSTSLCYFFRHKGAKERLHVFALSQREHEIKVILLRGREVFVVYSSMEQDGCSNLTYPVVIRAKNKCTHAEQ